MTIGGEIAAVKHCLKSWRWRAERYGVTKEQQARIDAMKAVLARLEAIRRGNAVTHDPICDGSEQ